MTELPERLLSGSAGEWEKALLESAQLDAPSIEFKRTFSRRLSVALGSASVLISGTSHALGGVTWMKWLAVGFMVGTAGAGGGVQLSNWIERDAPAVTRPSAKARPIHATVSRTSPEPRAPDATESPSAEQVVPSNPAKGVNTPPVAAFALLNSVPSRNDAAASPAAAPALRAEMARLESIRAALSRGDARAALRNLDIYDSEYPSGALSIESRVLRIEALAAASESRAAVALVQRFLSEHPDSPYAKRIASLALAVSKANP
jgi:hypothetical protein